MKSPPEHVANHLDAQGWVAGLLHGLFVEVAGHQPGVVGNELHERVGTPPLPEILLDFQHKNLRDLLPIPVLNTQAAISLRFALLR